MWKLPALPLAALLTSCASDPITVVKPIIIPAAMFQCAPNPPVPDQPVSDTDLAVFLLRQDDAWRDCRDTLGEVRATFQAQGGETP